MFLDILFPKFCLNCGESGEYACYKCLCKLLQFVEVQSCPDNMFFDNLIACLQYDKNNFLRKLVARFKYKGAESLTVYFADLMINSFIKYGNVFENYLVVPVPMHKKRLKIRGFNQAERLATLIAFELGYPYDAILLKILNTENQSHLGRDDRLRNIAGSIVFDSDADIHGRNVLLVDDVATTLTTLNECSKVLKGAGAQSITCLVLARAMPISLNLKYENRN